MTIYEPPGASPPASQPPDFNPYRPPDAQVADVQSSAPGELSSRRRRLGAQLINGTFMMTAMIPWIVAVIIVMVRAGEEALLETDPLDVYSPAFYQQGGTAGTVLTALTIGLVLVLSVVNLVLMVRSAQSVGKRLVGIKVQRMNGSQPSIWRLLFLRYLPVGLVSNIPILGFFIGVFNLGLILTMDKRCGHDYIAGTRVVRV